MEYSLMSLPSDILIKIFTNIHNIISNNNLTNLIVNYNNKNKEKYPMQNHSKKLYKHWMKMHSCLF